jgi:hypothetical protein
MLKRKHFAHQGTILRCCKDKLMLIYTVNHFENKDVKKTFFSSRNHFEMFEDSILHMKKDF